MKLYSVTTAVKEFNGCRNVIFHWFRHAMPQGRRPYADLIKNYEPGKLMTPYTEEFIEEPFTLDEARQLKAYLDQSPSPDARTTTARLMPHGNQS